MSTRAVSPVVAVALLALVTALCAAVVGVAVLETTGEAGPEDPPRVSLSVTADAATDRIALTHRGGDPLAVDRLRVLILVDGRRLAHQPPVPFFAAEGFRSGPTGPFNVATEGPWVAGQTAALRLAATNSPSLDAGSRVTVRVYHDGTKLAEVTARA